MTRAPPDPLMPIVCSVAGSANCDGVVEGLVPITASFSCPFAPRAKLMMPLYTGSLRTHNNRIE